MGALSNYLENKLLDHALGTTAFTMPGSTGVINVALFNNANRNTTTYPDPQTSSDALEANDIAGAGEITGGSYARQTAAFGAAAAGATSNSADISFTSMPATTVTHVAVLHDDTADNVLFYGALAASKTLNAGDTFTIKLGDLDISLD